MDAFKIKTRTPRHHEIPLQVMYSTIASIFSIPALIASTSLTAQTESPVGVELADHGVACDADGKPRDG